MNGTQILKNTSENRRILNEFIYEVIDEPQSLKPSSALKIFTSEEAKPDVDCDWFYRIIDEDDNLPSNELSNYLAVGKISLCSCSECMDFKGHLSEYFSVLRALILVQIYTPESRVELWVGSEKFLDDSDTQVFEDYEEIYHCPILRQLGNELSVLMRELEVDVFHYAYGNKDAIPYFF